MAKCDTLADKLLSNGETDMGVEECICLQLSYNCNAHSPDRYVSVCVDQSLVVYGRARLLAKWVAGFKATIILINILVSAMLYREQLVALSNFVQHIYTRFRFVKCTRTETVTKDVHNLRITHD